MHADGFALARYAPDELRYLPYELELRVRLESDHGDKEPLGA